MSYTIYNPGSGYTYGNLTVGAPTGASGYTYTSSGTSATDMIWNNTGTWGASNPVTITQKAQIELQGDDADIKINGESLKDAIREIKEALRIPGRLARDEKLEKDWEELLAAADHYTKLLKEYQDKQKVWNTLKD
jgi:hypothetical protein